MTRTFGKDLTVGSVPSALVRLAAPIFLANLLSSGYAIVNTVWVGHLLGGPAVAAVAVTFPIVLLMVALCNGLTTATSVLVAQHYGARREGEIQRVVDTSWTLGAVLVAGLTVAGVVGAPQVLRAMRTPVEVMPLAVPYLRLTFCGLTTMYASFLCMSTLRAIGNTRVPLAFVLVGTGINAALDPLLIAGVGPFPALGLNGAAAASLVAGGVAATSCLAYLKIRYAASPIHPRGPSLDRARVRELVGIGFPSFVQQALFSLAVAVVTSLVNAFGPLATAAFGVAGRIDTLVAMPAMAVLAAVSTVTAQNLGAGKPERVREVFRWGLVVNTPAILLTGLAAVGASAPVMRLFVKDPEIVRLGAGYLRIVGFGYLLLILPYVTNGIIIGAGRTAVPMAISFVSLILVRLPLATWLSRTSLGLTGVWVAMLVGYPVNAALGLAYYLSGRWRRPLAPPRRDEPELPLGASPAE